ncbi:MAG: ribosomal L7Ae/L30e/S12e/Gadd45 family protein [Clostridia bacterium]|nr:ribosomal L7Ae/L30e/S12e/Gadd45 family protein [Clostridia bacterium]
MNEYLKVLGNIGLAARARKITLGNELTCEAISAGKVRMVLMCESASSNTAKKLADYCGKNGVELCRIPVEPVALASAVGKSKPLMSVGITDDSLCIPVRNSIKALSNATSSQQISESEV